MGICIIARVDVIFLIIRIVQLTGITAVHIGTQFSGDRKWELAIDCREYGQRDRGHHERNVEYGPGFNSPQTCCPRFVTIWTARVNLAR